MWGHHVFKSWNSQHSHYNKHLCTKGHGFVFVFCILFIHIMTSVLSLSTWFLMWLLGLVWTAGAGAVVYSRLDLLEKREFWHCSKDLPLTFSPTLFLYTKQHSAQWHAKHQKCQKSCWCLSLSISCLSFLRVLGEMVPARPNTACWIDQTHMRACTNSIF